MQHKILIVEDDVSLCNGIVLALKNDDYLFSSAHTLAEAEKLCKENTFQLIILDINLPDGNGVEFLRQIKSRFAVSVIMLTANDMEIDIVTGLESGADDYITKPFSLMVLRARVNTQLKKVKTQNKFLIDDFSFDFETMNYSKGNKSIELSKIEQKLLWLLLSNKGNTISRQVLLDKVWNDGAEYVDENSLSVSIKRLRDKLEDNSSKPKYIKTIYGIGYSWVVK
ncbi:response regulator transcription factor [Tissierella sp. MB52-C2]|uniref:response regulator transcription factor n=1 Tax=Tissierella sp. MB52-C2 TaxID=3070999 RepID=UPI00280AA23D|nr:response regulator transcription factor [Tissierella sp. MB52-C2]WMM26080.1 response regulator transcription factor [Tissierella sp. MB52-C2]